MSETVLCCGESRSFLSLLSDCPICAHQRLLNCGIETSVKVASGLEAYIMCMHCHNKVTTEIKGIRATWEAVSVTSFTDIRDCFDILEDKWSANHRRHALKQLLNNCPCCNEEIVNIEFKQRGGGLEAKVYCLQCDLNISRVGDMTSYSRILKAVVNTWNRREGKLQKEI